MATDITAPGRSKSIVGNESLRAQFRRGFIGIMPLWPGAIPFGIAFAILARSTGFSALETQALSLFIYAGSAQLAIVSLYATGASALLIVITAIVLNLRHVLYGLSLNERLSGDERLPKPLLAFFLTDESYGVTLREYLASRGGAAILFGSGLSLYLIFNLSTLVGVLFGSLLPDPEGIGLSFIFPLMFLALLLPLIRSWRAVVVALVSAVVMLGMLEVTSSGLAFLTAAVTASVLGASLDGHAERVRAR